MPVVMTLSEAKERILVELWLQPRPALTVAELKACLNGDGATVERAVAELVAGGQLFNQGAATDGPWRGTWWWRVSRGRPACAAAPRSRVVIDAEVGRLENLEGKARVLDLVAPEVLGVDRRPHAEEQPGQCGPRRQAVGVTTVVTP